MKSSILLVTDLDGTLVYDSQNVHEKDASALRLLAPSVSTAIATGRSIKEIKYIEQQVGVAVDYHIAFNGALVQDKNGNTLIDIPLETSTVKKMCKVFEENDIVFDALDGIARWGNFQHEKPNTLWGMEFISITAPYDILFDKKIYKINVRPEKSGTTNIVELLNKEVPEVIAYQTGSSRIEVTSRLASKAEGIEACLTDKEQKIITIGDASNDVEMFNIANVSYCMEHAPTTVKEEAKKVVPHFADAISDIKNLYKV